MMINAKPAYGETLLQTPEDALAASYKYCIGGFYKMDDSLNSIFDEIRMNFFIHNSCLIQKYVDIFKIIYNNHI
jgi:hypothetical protein